METNTNTSNNSKTAANKALASTEESIGQQIWTVLFTTGSILVLLVKILFLIAESVYHWFVPLPQKSVRGEVVLVTGAGHGIGKELALKYAAEGATVVIWDINKENNEKTAEEIYKLGYGKAHAYTCDVSSRDNVLEVAKKVQEEVGDVSILINNAGIMPTHSLHDHTHEEIERIMGINVFAHFWTIEAFLPAMKKNNHGHIVALSSCAGLAGIQNLVPYCATKFAVYGLMEALHEELRADPKNQIQITIICPYMVDTGLCKKPKLRFEKAMALLDPKYVADEIMKAQRRDVVLTTLPGYLLNIVCVTRVLPFKAQMLIQDFIDSRLESDLD